MKLRILTITILSFAFFSFAHAGICFPVAQVYMNPKTGIEKLLPLNGALHNFTSPLPITSFTKSGEAFDFGVEMCGGKDIENLQQLAFDDFSNFDKIKIIFNGIIYILLPLSIFFIIFFAIIKTYRRTQSLPLKIFLDIIFFILAIILLLIVHSFYLLLANA